MRLTCALAVLPWIFTNHAHLLFRDPDVCSGLPQKFNVVDTSLPLLTNVFTASR